MPGVIQRWLNDEWRRWHGWRVVTINGVKTWIRVNKHGESE